MKEKIETETSRDLLDDASIVTLKRINFIPTAQKL